jgi:hypothetical protein
MDPGTTTFWLSLPHHLQKKRFDSVDQLFCLQLTKLFSLKTISRLLERFCCLSFSAYEIFNG